MHLKVTWYMCNEEESQSYTCCTGGRQAGEVAQCLRDAEVFETVRLGSDLRGVERFVTAQRAAGV